MPQMNRKELSRAIAQLMPYIIQGVHLGFLAAREITHTQFFVLIAIHAQGSCPMSALAEKVHVTMPTMTGIVDRLVSAGYVQRTNDPKDRRQVVIELSQKGKLFIAQFQTAVSTRWEEVLQTLDPKEVEVFSQVVSKLQGKLRAGKPNETKK